jgi:hypothetical protein
MDPGLRASDDDRMRVVAALERHTAAGRLTLDEFSDRVSRALAAGTRHELAAVTRDLPPDVVPGAVSRQLLVAFLLAMLTLAVLGVILAVAR